MQHAIVERVGGDGGGPWDDRDYLQEQGWELGWGSRGVMLCSITYPGWDYHLCRGRRAYQAAQSPGVRVTTPERGGNSPERTATASWDPRQERVAAVHIRHGACNYRAGNHCINAMKVDLEPLLAGAPAARSVTFRPAFMDIDGSDDGDTATITIPPGHTLSGLCGRSGDSLDNLGLIIGPHLPPCLVNLADVAHPDFLARCPVDFQQQAAALTAALQGMPTDVVAGLVGWLFTVTFHGQP